MKNNPEHPKTIIVSENSETTLVDILQQTEMDRSLKIILHKGAKLNHVLIPGVDSKETFLTAHIHQHADSHYSGSVFMLKGQKNQTNIQIHLNEPNASCEFRALEWGRFDQSHDLTLDIHHHAEACKSQVVTRSVMTDRARGSFTGKIRVHKNAAHTQAALQSKNLLLSSTAEVKTQPQLEIDHDNVQCSHGATTGHLDLEALFYLQSRGIPEIEAKRMLIAGFIHPAFQLLPKGDLLGSLEALLYEH